MTRSSGLFFKYLRPLISLKNGSVLKVNLWMSGFKWDWPQQWELFIFGKNKQNPWCNLVKSFKKVAPWFCQTSPEIRSLHGWGLSHLKPYIKRFVLSTEPFLRDIFGLRYETNIFDLSLVFNVLPSSVQVQFQFSPIWTET